MTITGILMTLAVERLVRQDNRFLASGQVLDVDAGLRRNPCQLTLQQRLQRARLGGQRGGA
ncbi:MAG: hypothetical protein R2712_19420 [Vicinamibacterales bacterium]